MPTRFESVDTPAYEYDPNPSMRGFGALVDLGSQMAQGPVRSGQPPARSADANNVAAFIDSSERQVKQLRSRQQMFEIQNEITAATRMQEAKEADFALEPLISQLSAFAGSENWAGVYAFRRKILEHPAYGKASEVKKVMSELDMGLKNWGSEITTDGREVSFQDVARMAGSSDAAEQKEAFRILALRSESASGFIDALPIEQINSRDPLFRAQLKSFIRDNPRVTRDDFVKYKAAENQYLESLKQRFADDPVLAAQMIASPEVKEALSNMRASMLTGKAGRETDWLPALSSDDFALKSEDMKDLADVMDKRIGDSMDTFVMEVGKGIENIFSGSADEVEDKMRNNPRLAELSRSGLLPRAYDDKSLGDYLGSVTSPAATAAFYAARSKGISSIKALQAVLSEYGKKSIINRLVAGGATAANAARTANFAGAANFARIGAGALTSAVAPALLILGGGEGIRAGLRQKKIDAVREESRSALAGIEKNKKLLLGQIQSGGGTQDVVSTLNSLATSIEQFNSIAMRTGAEFQLDLPNIYGQAQWKAIYTRLMLNEKTRQRMIQSGLEGRVGIQAAPGASPLPAAAGPATLSQGSVFAPTAAVKPAP